MAEANVETRMSVATVQSFCDDDQALHDIQDYVTIVVQYKCRACNFVCDSSASIRCHVIGSHLHRVDENQVTEIRSCEVSAQTISSDTANLVSATDLFPATTSDNNSMLYASADAPNGVPNLSHSTNGYLSAVDTNSDLPAAQDVCGTLTDQAVQLIVANESVPFNMPSCFGERESTVLQVGNVQANPSSQPLHIATANSELPLVVQNVSGQSSEVSEQLSEMYVCDSCRTAFDNAGIMEHMLQVHGVQFMPARSSDTETNTATTAITDSLPYFVSRACSTDDLSYFVSRACSTESSQLPVTASVGIQTQLSRKPGRKRKIPSAEKVQQLSASQTSETGSGISERDTAAAMAVQVLGIVRADGECERTKRRIQPPRALVQDYHIQRIRQPKPRSCISTLPLALMPEIPCTVAGCKAVCYEESALEYHRKCHVDNSAFSCPECTSGMIFTDWLGVLEHLWSAHGKNLFPCRCDRCAFHAESLSSLTEHFNTKHGGQTFKKANLRNYHEKSRASQGRRAQTVCASYSSLACDVCKRSFATKKSLKKHIEIVHKKVKPFACSQCNYVAACKAMLQVHVRTHTGDKPFQCDVCTYSASDHNTLRRHRMRHTGQKPYRCALCSYTAIQSISLKLHMRAKHPNSVVGVSAAAVESGTGATAVYTCQLCRYQTVNRRSWCGHLEDHRNNLIAVPATADQDSVSRTSDSAPLEQLFVVQGGDDGQLVLAPVVQASDCTTMAADPLTVPSNVTELTHVDANQLGLRHILTAISEQQQVDNLAQTS